MFVPTAPFKKKKKLNSFYQILNHLPHDGFNNKSIAGKRIQRSHDHTGLGRPAVHHLLQGSRTLQCWEPLHYRRAHWYLGKALPSLFLLGCQCCTYLFSVNLIHKWNHFLFALRSQLVQSLGCVLYCMMMLEGPYDLVFQKGDSVALAVQNPVSIPSSCRLVKIFFYFSFLWYCSVKLTQVWPFKGFTWKLNKVCLFNFKNKLSDCEFVTILETVFAADDYSASLTSLKYMQIS